jgi:hypothetical protein
MYGLIILKSDVLKIYNTVGRDFGKLLCKDQALLKIGAIKSSPLIHRLKVPIKEIALTP